MQTADWPIYGQSTLGYFMFNDCSNSRNTSPEKYYFGVMRNDNAYKELALKSGVNEGSPFLCLWYEPYEGGDSWGNLVSNDKFFRNIDMVVMRDSWLSDQETFTGMVVQEASLSHGHMKSGTFALDALGERWITNLGNDNYSAEYWDNSEGGKRWKHYPTRAEANSCLVINPSDYGGQYIYAKDTISEMQSSENSAFAITDLTETYKGQVDAYKRDLMLYNQRGTVVVQDEVDLTEASEVYSFINFYDAMFDISEDKKTVTVSKGNKKLRVNIICDQPYDVSVMLAKGLDTSDCYTDKRQFNEYNRLAIHFENVENINLRVEITPYLFDEDIAGDAAPVFVPMEQWTLDEDTTKKPVLSGLQFDGVDYAEFNPYNRCYELELAEGESMPANVTALADETLYNVVCTKDEAKGLWKIIVSDKNNAQNVNSYIVCEKKGIAPNVIDKTGMNKLNIVAATASDFQNEDKAPGKAIDGDMTTNWAGNYQQWLCLELEKESVVDCIRIAWSVGDARKAYFDLEVSADGTTWEKVNSTLLKSCGATTDFEDFNLGGKTAKYVRYSGYGNSLSGWNAIFEVEVYGK